MDEREIQATLRSARSAGWQIGPVPGCSEGQVQALSKPTQTAEHIVVGRDTRELAERLAVKLAIA